MPKSKIRWLIAIAGTGVAPLCHAHSADTNDLSHLLAHSLQSWSTVELGLLALGMFSVMLIATARLARDRRSRIALHIADKRHSVVAITGIDLSAKSR